MRTPSVRGPGAGRQSMEELESTLVDALCEEGLSDYSARIVAALREATEEHDSRLLELERKILKLTQAPSGAETVTRGRGGSVVLNRG